MVSSPVPIHRRLRRMSGFHYEDICANTFDSFGHEPCSKGHVSSYKLTVIWDKMGIFSRVIALFSGGGVGNRERLPRRLPNGGEARSTILVIDDSPFYSRPSRRCWSSKASMC